jgi:AhpD family alkylhydroperoxidase
MAYQSLFEALAPRRHLARSLAGHLREIRDGTVATRTKELIALMVAWLNACDYCTCVHEELAAHVGVDAQTLAELGDYARSDRFSPAERAALAATVSLTREPRALPQNLWDDLLAHYDEGDCIEILCTIGLNNYMSRLSNALGVRPTPPAPAT